MMFNLPVFFQMQLRISGKGHVNLFVSWTMSICLSVGPNQTANEIIDSDTISDDEVVAFDVYTCTVLVIANLGWKSIQCCQPSNDA